MILRPPRGRAPTSLRARATGRAVAAAALVLLLGGLSAPAAFARGGGGAADGPVAADFDGVVAAWRARNAERVAAFVPQRGRVWISLQGTGGDPVAGRASRQNAQAILSEYFEDVGRVSLVDATPADARGPSRVYDYTYRPKGGETRTTNLTLTLGADGDGGYALVEISERQRSP